MQRISWLAEKLAVYQELCLMQLVTLQVPMVKSRSNQHVPPKCQQHMSAKLQCAPFQKAVAHLKVFTTKCGSNWSHTNIYVMKHTGCGLTRTQQISNKHWLVWHQWPASEKLLMMAGKWKCEHHFSLERKTVKNVNYAVITIMVWVQASFITQNGTQFLSHFMKSHDLGIIQLAQHFGKGRNLLSQWNCD
jgi:hypothetical protein